MLKNKTLRRFLHAACLVLIGCDPPPTTSTPSSISSDPDTTASSSASTNASSATTPDPPAPVKPAGPATIAVTASNQFGLDLYQKLRTDNGNLAYSPTSISLALAMTYAGAKGDTATQMRMTMHLPDDAASLHGSWATVLSDWSAPKDVEIAVANRLFGDKSYSFESAFLGLTKDRYGAPLEQVDFAGAPEAQRLYINGWVMKQTRDRIKDLIPKDAVTADTRMALVNAIYFKAQWDEPFMEQATKDAPFSTQAGKDVTAAMMASTKAYRYYDSGDAQFVPQCRTVFIPCALYAE